MNSATDGRGGSEPPLTKARRQREVIVVGHDAPPRAASTRPKHLRKLAGARKYVFALALIGGGLFVLGATTGKLLWALLPPAVVLAVIIALVWREATRLAERDFFAGHALSRGYNYSERKTLPHTTPLLSAGDRRHAEHYFEGPLEGLEGVDVGVGHYVYETHEQRNDRRRRPISVYTPHAFTVTVTELPRAQSVFQGVHLVRRGSWFGGDDDWLERDELTPIELENGELAGRCDLFVNDEQDRERLAKLLKPSFQAWMAQMPFQMYFEYAGGTLVVFVPRRLRRTEDIEDMLIATGWIAKRIVQEGEPLKAVNELLSKAPPTGAEAFPPPPPATKPRVETKLRVAPEPVETPAYTRASVPPPSIG